MPVSNSIISLPHQETTAAWPVIVQIVNDSGLGQFLRYNVSNENFARKLLLAGSVTVLGVAASAFGYRVYRSYLLNKNISDSNRLFQQIDFETNLTKSMRSTEEIEEVSIIDLKIAKN